MNNLYSAFVCLRKANFCFSRPASVFTLFGPDNVIIVVVQNIIQ